MHLILGIVVDCIISEKKKTLSKEIKLYEAHFYLSTQEMAESEENLDQKLFFKNQNIYEIAEKTFHSFTCFGSGELFPPFFSLSRYKNIN
jgi:hypothetical protein